ATPAWQKALRLGLWIAAGTAFAPILLPMSLAGLLAVLVVGSSDPARRAVLGSIAPALACAAALLGPWLAQRALHPWRVWWAAGLAVSGEQSLTAAVFGGWSGPGSGAWWILLGVLVLGVLSLVPSATRSAVRWAWTV